MAAALLLVMLLEVANPQARSGGIAEEMPIQEALRQEESENGPGSENPLREYRHGEGLRVLVLQDSGEPLPGATLMLFSESLEAGDERSSLGEPLECSNWENAEKVAISGVDGKAVFYPQEPGRFCIAARLDGFVPMRLGPFVIGSFARTRRSVTVPFVIVLPATYLAEPVGIADGR